MLAVMESGLLLILALNCVVNCCRLSLNCPEKWSAAIPYCGNAKASCLSVRSPESTGWLRLPEKWVLIASEPCFSVSVDSRWLNSVKSRIWPVILALKG